MNSPVPWLRRLYPRLGVPLLAALLVHGLWLSYINVRRSRQAPPPPALTAADDTPELLRFSRQQPMASSLASIPLPPASLLPPPPPDLREEAGPLQPPPNKPGMQALTRPQGTPPRSKKRLVIADAGARRRTPQPPVAPPGGAKEEPPPLALLEDLQQQAEAPSGSVSSEAKPQKGVSGLLRVDGSAAQAYENLWDGAQLPGDTAVSSELAKLPSNVQLRRLPLDQARALGINPVHRQGVALDGGVVLFWVDGSTLWLLRTSGSSQPGG